MCEQEDNNSIKQIYKVLEDATILKKQIRQERDLDKMSGQIGEMYLEIRRNYCLTHNIDPLMFLDQEFFDQFTIQFEGTLSYDELKFWQYIKPLTPMILPKQINIDWLLQNNNLIPVDLQLGLSLFINRYQSISSK